MLHWLSFADTDLPKGQQFLGVAIVEASSFPEAVMISHMLGFNPGGQVAGTEIPDHAPQPAEHWRDRLLTKADIAKLEGEAWQMH